MRVDEQKFDSLDRTPMRSKSVVGKSVNRVKPRTRIKKVNDLAEMISVSTM